MIYAKCVKETYTWEGDGKQHKFSKVIEGHIYGFKRLKTHIGLFQKLVLQKISWIMVLLVV